MRGGLTGLLCAALLLASTLPAKAQALYTPQTPRAGAIVTKDLSLPYPDRDRPLEIRITYPPAARDVPLLIWSHGLGGSREAYEPLISVIASYGYAVIQPTHGDSLKYGRITAADFLQASERPKEISFILDTLEDIETKVPGLAEVIDESKIAAGGHSFGAHTTNLLAGMTTKRPFNFFNEKRKNFSDTRISAFIAMSPQGTSKSVDEKSFSTITAPILYVTGSEDKDSFSKKPYTWRMECVQGAASREKYLLFLQGAAHNLGGISGRQFPNAGADNANFLAAVQSTSLAFLDAYIKGDKAAYDYLNSDSLRQISANAAYIQKNP